MQGTTADILDFRNEAISDAYEVVQTVGFTLTTAAGSGDCRVEVIRRPGAQAFAAWVAVRDGFGAWRRDPFWESETVNRASAAETLVAAMEHIGRKAAEVAAPEPEPEPAAEVSDEITPEILSVLSAAVAAFLGKKARIRGARLLRGPASSAWAQQGRVSVQGSHFLARG